MGKELFISMYHYVRPIKDSAYKKIKGMELSDFLRQLDYFEKEYCIVTMEDVIEAAENEKLELPNKALLLTFDDGYMDHYEYVFKELKKRKLQGSFFIPTQILTGNSLMDVNKIHFILAKGEIERVCQWLFERMDRLRKDGVDIPQNEVLFKKLAIANRWDNKEVIFVKRLLQNELPEEIRSQITDELFDKVLTISQEEFAKKLYLDFEKIEEMKSNGMFFGSHGNHHYHLGKQKKDVMMQDISTATELLLKQNIMDKDKMVMNYPYGSFNDETILFSKKAGYRLGVSVKPGTANLLNDNKMLLPRYDTNDFYPRGIL